MEIWAGYRGLRSSSGACGAAPSGPATSTVCALADRACIAIKQIAAPDIFIVRAFAIGNPPCPTTSKVLATDAANSGRYLNLMILTEKPGRKQAILVRIDVPKFDE